MTLGGILAESYGYPVDDMAAMVDLVVMHCVAVARREGVEPVGALELSFHETVFGVEPDRAWRWTLELTP